MGQFEKMASLLVREKEHLTLILLFLDDRQVLDNFEVNLLLCPLALCL